MKERAENHSRRESPFRAGSIRYQICSSERESRVHETRHRRHPRPDGGGTRRHHRRRADAPRLQPFLLRLPRRSRTRSRAAPSLRAAGARSARQARCDRRTVGAARLGRGRGIRTAPTPRAARRCDTEGRVPALPQRALVRTINTETARADRSAVAMCVGSGALARRAAGDYRYEHFDECYAHREEPTRFVDLFNRTIAPCGRVASDAPRFGTQGHPSAGRVAVCSGFGMDVDEIH